MLQFRRYWRTVKPDISNLVLLILGLLIFQCSAIALAQDASSDQTSGRPAWGSLNKSQQDALRPLKQEWGQIDATRKAKWIEIADRFPTFSPAKKARIQERMTEWVSLSPRERGQARLNFKEAQQLNFQDRKARWEDYKALSPDQRRKLAERAAPTMPRSNDQRPRTEATHTKSNIVPNTSYGARPKPVAPTVIQAQPGVSTNLISKRASPPSHQQSGLPKIVVTPSFVDRSTLLPMRGPQGAGTRAVPPVRSKNPEGQ